jgi:hypothetical protein
MSLPVLAILPFLMILPIDSWKCIIRVFRSILLIVIIVIVFLDLLDAIVSISCYTPSA